MSENDVIWKTDKLKVKLTGDRLTFYVFNSGEGIEDIEITQFSKFWLTENGFEVTKKEAELKPCPFCGKEAIKQGSHNRYWVGCRNCKINSDRFFHEETAIKAWNDLPRKNCDCK